LHACALPDSGAAWEEFMRRYHHVITAAAVRVSRRWGEGTSQEIDDVIQEVYLKLCADRARILIEFRSSQPEAIFGYVKTVATNLAHDFFRRRGSNKRGLGRTTSLEEVAEHGSPSDAERRVALAEVERQLIAATQNENSGRDRAIFWFYYRYGMTAQAISELPGIELNSKGVEGVLHRVTRAIRHRLFNPQEPDAFSRPKESRP
jgi:RNA polymerase sigma-70 factor (ECF subfamily)